MDRLFAVCIPGLEPFLAGELDQLGLPTIHSSSRSEDSSLAKESADEIGGVEFRSSLPDLYRANLRLRTASRMFLRLDAFYADSFSNLRSGPNGCPGRTISTPGERYRYELPAINRASFTLKSWRNGSWMPLETGWASSRRFKISR